MEVDIMPAEWEKIDLSGHEGDINTLVDIYMDEHPEIDLPTMTAVLANCLLSLMKPAPSWMKITVLNSLNRGDRIELERERQS